MVDDLPKKDEIKIGSKIKTITSITDDDVYNDIDLINLDL